MSVSPYTQAVLLLTAYFGKASNAEPKPLSRSEWGRFAEWLKDQGISLETLLRQDPARVLVHWADSTITLKRVEILLSRGGALGLAMEKWERAGLWVLTLSDPDYPERLKRLLKANSPPVFFGCGNRNLLDRGGIAVVGSRDASEQDLVFTWHLGGEAAEQGLSIVSGGARGVDDAAMLGALEREGTVVGILSDSLLQAATSKKYRKALMGSNLVLLSSANPDAGFSVGNAMGRNKYIYCLADAAIVIATSNGKGGTWAGALENLQNGWVPLFVKSQNDRRTGNSALVEQGARWLPEGGFQLSSLFSEAGVHQVRENLREGVFAAVLSESPRESTVVDRFGEYGSETGAGEPRIAGTNVPDTLSFYELFLHRLEQLTRKTPAKPSQLLESLGVNNSQLKEWLKRAVDERHAEKLSKPVRYTWRSIRTQQVSLFGDPDASSRE